MSTYRKKFSDKTGPVFLSLIILVPFFFAIWHFNNFLSERTAKNRSLAEASLVSEMNDFQQSLSTRTALERVMQETGEKLGLVMSNTEIPYSTNVDPEIYKTGTAKKIQEFVFNRFGFSPAYVLSVGYMGHHFDYWVSKKVNQSDPFAFGNLHRVSAMYLAKAIKEQFQVDPELVNNLLFYTYDGEKICLPNDRSSVNNYLRCYFSGISEFPSDTGICFDFATSRIGGKKVYMYVNGLHTEKRFAGGFFIVFSADVISPNFLLKNAMEYGHKKFLRKLVKFKPNLVGNFVANSGQLSYFEELPTAFLTDFPDLTDKSDDFSTGKYLLQVSAPMSHFNGTIEAAKKGGYFFSRIFFLLFFASFSYYNFFGMPIKLRLRNQFFLITGIIVLIPFLFISYFSVLLLQNIENVGLREVESESDTKLFKVARFVKDLGIRRQIVSLQAKKIITEFSNNGSSKINYLELEKCLPTTLLEDTGYYSIDGQSKVFCVIDPGKDPRRMTTMLSVKYLNALGVLNLNSPEAKRELELVGLANGFMEELAKDFLEGKCLALESQETRDLSELNDIHRMITYLIPDLTLGHQTVKAICFKHLFGISKFANSFERLGENPSLLLNEDSDFLSHRFVLGERKIEGSVSRWFPQVLRENDKLRLLLEYAANSKSSGKLAKSLGQSKIVSSWQFYPDSEVLIAGISTSAPNLWISYFAWLFPVVMGLFSFISLILISDILGHLLAKPIQGFVESIKQIQGGNYGVRIDIEKTDEFSLLSDSFNSMAAGLEQREKLRRFVSEKLFENVQKDHTLTDHGAENLEMAILASDIRGFTTLTEQNDPTEVVSLLNEYFTEMCKAIVDNNGVVERFIGDAVVAIFYANDIPGNHSKNAIKAAIEMRKNLADLNQKRRRENKFLVENGIGIVSDHAVSAITGSESGRKVFTVLGKAVARAGEIEALTAQVKGNRILVCEKTYTNSNKDFSLKIVLPKEKVYQLF